MPSRRELVLRGVPVLREKPVSGRAEDCFITQSKNWSSRSSAPSRPSEAVPRSTILFSTRRSCIRRATARAESIQRRAYSRSRAGGGLFIVPPDASLRRIQPHLRTQYSEQYNLTIQHQLTNDMMFQIGYVGSQGHRLLASHDINASNPQTCLDIRSIANASPAAVTFLRIAGDLRSHGGRFAMECHGSEGIPVPHAERQHSSGNRPDPQPGWAAAVFIAELQSIASGIYARHRLPRRRHSGFQQTSSPKTRWQTPITTRWKQCSKNASPTACNSRRPTPSANRSTTRPPSRRH